MKKKQMAAGKFKAECLRIMEEVKMTGQELVVTKRSIPIVKLCPLDKIEGTLFGKMRGTVHIKGDIIQSIEENWNADH